MKLRDKTMVLTGATGGIGSALAVTLADAGARLILVGRDSAKLQMLQSSLAKGSRAHLLFVADISDASQRNALVALCQQEGIDGLINNAGVCQFALLGDTSELMIEDMVIMNLQVPMFLTKALLPDLAKRAESVVINIGSAFGSIGYPAYSAYCGTKFGLRGFSEALRREVADTRVHVMHIEPRSTRTAINSAQVVAMNEALGNTMDSPEYVAARVLDRLERGKWGGYVIGWPERFYAWVNNAFPSVTDKAIYKALGAIKRFAQPRRSDVA